MKTGLVETRSIGERLEAIATEIEQAQNALGICYKRLDEIGDDQGMHVADVLKIVWRHLDGPYTEIVELGEELAGKTGGDVTDEEGSDG